MATLTLTVGLWSWVSAPTAAAAPLPVTRLAYGKATAKWTAEAQRLPSVRVACSAWTPRPASLACTFYDPTRAGSVIVAGKRAHVFGRFVLQRTARCGLLVRSYGPTLRVTGERTLDTCRAEWWRQLPPAPR